MVAGNGRLEMNLSSKMLSILLAEDTTGLVPKLHCLSLLSACLKEVWVQDTNIHYSSSD